VRLAPATLRRGGQPHKIALLCATRRQAKLPMSRALPRWQGTRSAAGWARACSSSPCGGIG